ncbi:MAG: DNA-3-methyladenine glycosylase I [Methanobacteriota archaeon]|nr:MAG: DNA-3-methyladenine glycosylase I [Euryarchaeota archaeon]
MRDDSVKRCEWALGDPALLAYHDAEWGVPEHDDRKLFEFLVLEGAQAGLSWLTVLKKREAFRKAFDGFDPVKVAQYDSRKVRTLLADAGIIRNRAKIAAAIENAKAFLIVEKEFGSFDAYIWRFAGRGPKPSRRKTLKQIPARTKESDEMSEDLKSRGFKFVGSTICYAYMQAVGMVNDHLTDCFRSDQRYGMGTRPGPGGSRRK